ncbi:MAG: hypothetical protein ABFR53_10615 [Actinomycetota bacterium]
MCGEADALVGVRSGESIDLTCEACGAQWVRSLEKRCERCGGADIQTVPMAIVERSRGTQLSVLGTRPIDLCSNCDSAKLAKYHANRPNPLMPDALPTVGEEQMNG